jgi:hypothetical protein
MRWFILERREHRREWSDNEAAAGLIASADQFQALKCGEEGKASGRYACVLFLERDDKSSLPVKIEKGEEVKVWCHYGGDFLFTELPDKWRNLGGLRDEDKALLSGDFLKHPLPISVGQRLDWSEEFIAIKRIFREGAVWDQHKWGELQLFLDSAWRKADREAADLGRLAVLVQIFPLALGLRHIKTRLPEDPWTDPITLAGELIGHYTSAGLSEAGTILAALPTDKQLKPLQEAHQDIEDIVDDLRRAWSQRSPRVAISLNELKEQLSRFHEAYRGFAQIPGFDHRKCREEVL